MCLLSGASRVLRHGVLIVACGAIISLLSQVSTLADEAKEVRIGYHFTPDTPMNFKIEFGQEFEIQGYSFSTLIDLEYTETCVEARDDTLFKMEIMITNASAQMKRNDDLIDSPLDEDLTNQAFVFEIDRHGMISGVRATGYLQKEAEVMKIVQVLLSGGYPYLPDSVMSAGGEWSFEGNTIEDPKSEYKIDTDSHFKIEGFKKENGRECAMIKEQGDRYASGRFENQGEAYVIDGQGEGKTEFSFDMAAGCIVKLKSETSAKITYIDASGGSAGERESQTSTTTYNLKKELK